MKTICLFLTFLTFGFAQASPNELNDRGLEAADHGDYAGAVKLFTEAIAQWRARGAAYDVHIAVVQVNLAQMACVVGERRRCAGILEEAVPVLRRKKGLKDEQTLTALNLLGGIEMMLGDHASALKAFEEALPVERESFPKDVQLARTLTGLGSLAMRENRAADAAPFLEEALALTLAVSGEDTLDAALAYANMAELHRVQGRPELAEPLFRKARAIYEKRLGPEHPRTASVLTQQGLMALHAGKIATADGMLTRALAALDKSCPNCGYERVAAESDLALVRIRQGKFDAADRLLSDVLARQELAGGLPPGEIAVTLNSLATVRQKERRYDDAERLKRRAALLNTAYR